eukprot:CAMPEP_0198260160 /NCGR_PEP_ID=MMETSP1447-20131203/9197_1 /TAXON_ID=420782 /ORGANISM="Chaetoceros dichaeta, Strain CCMP1751" /LENGTH=468 /DNA_ID=CAMNT_0043947747 /DNA_START=1 /DNA_END=1404 /DNA_ORIENTATION=+
MQMHMQMQAMNQQMAMMQMTQQQQRVNQMTTTSNNNNTNIKIASTTTAAATTKPSSSYQYNEYDDPIESALHDLPSNLDSFYRSAATAEQDVSSTNNADQQDIGHEGYVEGTSLDELATAWSEAERQIREDFEADEHLYGSGSGGATMEGNEKAYEFSPLSENYRTTQLQQPPNTDTTTTTTQTNDPQTDLMAEGMSHFQSGNTPEAILCFESELRHIDPDNSDAWLMLGKCHAENDQDSKAIVCLERAVERDPYNGEALLALGVSYVNELNHGPALKCLKDWVTHNPNYAGMDLVSAGGGGGRDVMPGVEVEIDGNRAQMEELKSLLYSVVDFHDNQNQNTQNQDSAAADALEALGVVLNVSRDYKDAISCFERATTLRPDSYQLWNKLGATLANGSRSDEALPAYHKALALKPKYARVWLNMAISHSNLKNHDEAARCYLQSLSLNEDAVHIWGYLRVALTCGERW